MNIRSRLLIALATLAVPVLAFAAPPAVVTGITAERTDTGVKVTWADVQDAARYQVYFSRSSILDSDGAYEDFEITTGPVTTHELKVLPAGQKLYVSVVAENASGEDSGAFAEEAVVELGGVTGPHLAQSSVPSSKGSAASASSASPPVLTLSSSAKSQTTSSTSSSSEAASSSAAVPDTHTFRVLTVQSISPTQVQVTFSDAVVIDPQDAMYAFRVQDGKGVMLPLQRLTMDGGRVTIDTYPQTEGVVYELLVGGVVRGKQVQSTGGEVLLPLDPSTSRVLFTGIGVNAAPPGVATLEVRNLRLRAIPEAQGRYTVEAQWIPPDRLDQVIGFVISQSADGGRTALVSQAVPRGTSMVRVRGVTIKNFGLRVQVVTPDNQMTRGVFAPITLLGGSTSTIVNPPAQSSSVKPVSSAKPATSSRMSASMSSSSSHATNGGHLPQTGAAVFLLAGVSVAGAGLLRRRLRRA